MPCIRSGIAASLAGHLWDPGATLLCGYSDFDTQIEHQKIDTRQLDGLSEFYKKDAAECSRIDLCIHCLDIQRNKHAGEKFEAGLDARTILMGTLLAARHLATKGAVGTILNLALIDSTSPKDPDLVRAAQELVVGVTRYAAQIAPQKVRALAVLPDRRAPTSLVHSGSNLGNGDNYPSRFDPDHLCRRLLWLFRQLLSSNFPWPSGSALCQDDIVEFSEI
jgi:hypothetical protein